MRAKEFIIEAKPENLSQGQMYKLSSAAIKKNDADDDGEDTALAKELADFIFKYVGPKYLIWTVNQYINDSTFSINDVDTLQDLLTKFDKIKANPRVQMKKDLMQYKSIEDLKTAVDQATETVGTIGTTYFSKAVERIGQLVKSGQAEWLYKGNDYVIYHPKTFEASHVMSALISTTLCTIMDPSNFDQYDYSGMLMYIIPNSEPDTLYNCYISRSVRDAPSEFANAQNSNKFDLNWQLEHFPKLWPLVLKAIGPGTDLKIQLLKFGTDEEKKQHCIKLIYDGFELDDVPVELRDYDVCAAALQEDKYAIRSVPTELQAKLKADLGL